jgi:hypothetical protein
MYEKIKSGRYGRRSKKAKPYRKYVESVNERMRRGDLDSNLDNIIADESKRMLEGRDPGINDVPASAVPARRSQ